MDDFLTRLAEALFDPSAEINPSLAPRFGQGPEIAGESAGIEEGFAGGDDDGEVPAGISPGSAGAIPADDAPPSQGASPSADDTDEPSSLFAASQSFPAIPSLRALLNSSATEHHPSLPIDPVVVTRVEPGIRSHPDPSHPSQFTSPDSLPPSALPVGSLHAARPGSDIVRSDRPDVSVMAADPAAGTFSDTTQQGEPPQESVAAISADVPAPPAGAMHSGREIAWPAMTQGEASSGSSASPAPSSASDGTMQPADLIDLPADHPRPGYQDGGMAPSLPASPGAHDLPSEPGGSVLPGLSPSAMPREVIPPEESHEDGASGTELPGPVAAGVSSDTELMPGESRAEERTSVDGAVSAIMEPGDGGEHGVPSGAIIPQSPPPRDSDRASDHPSVDAGAAVALSSEDGPSSAQSRAKAAERFGGRGEHPSEEAPLHSVAGNGKGDTAKPHVESPPRSSDDDDRADGGNISRHDISGARPLAPGAPPAVDSILPPSRRDRGNRLSDEAGRASHAGPASYLPEVGGDPHDTSRPYDHIRSDDDRSIGDRSPDASMDAGPISGRSTENDRSDDLVRPLSGDRVFARSGDTEEPAVDDHGDAKIGGATAEVRAAASHRFDKPPAEDEIRHTGSPSTSGAATRAARAAADDREGDRVDAPDGITPLSEPGDYIQSVPSVASAGRAESDAAAAPADPEKPVSLSTARTENVGALPIDHTVPEQDSSRHAEEGSIAVSPGRIDHRALSGDPLPDAPSVDLTSEDAGPLDMTIRPSMEHGGEKESHRDVGGHPVTDEDALPRASVPEAYQERMAAPGPERRAGRSGEDSASLRRSASPEAQVPAGRESDRHGVARPGAVPESGGGPVMGEPKKEPPVLGRGGAMVVSPPAITLANAPVTLAPGDGIAADITYHPRPPYARRVASPPNLLQSAVVPTVGGKVHPIAAAPDAVDNGIERSQDAGKSTFEDPAQRNVVQGADNDRISPSAAPDVSEHTGVILPRTDAGSLARYDGDSPADPGRVDLLAAGRNPDRYQEETGAEPRTSGAPSVEAGSSRASIAWRGNAALSQSPEIGAARDAGQPVADRGFENGSSRTWNASGAGEESEPAAAGNVFRGGDAGPATYSSIEPADRPTVQSSSPAPGSSRAVASMSPSVAGAPFQPEVSTDRAEGSAAPSEDMIGQGASPAAGSSRWNSSPDSIADSHVPPDDLSPRREECVGEEIVGDATVRPLIPLQTDRDPGVPSMSDGRAHDPHDSIIVPAPEGAHAASDGHASAASIASPSSSGVAVLPASSIPRVPDPSADSAEPLHATGPSEPGGKSVMAAASPLQVQPGSPRDEVVVARSERSAASSTESDVRNAHPRSSAMVSRPEHERRDEAGHDQERGPEDGQPALRPGRDRQADQVSSASAVEAADVPVRSIVPATGIDAALHGDSAPHRPHSEERSPSATRPGRWQGAGDERHPTLDGPPDAERSAPRPGMSSLSPERSGGSGFGIDDTLSGEPARHRPHGEEQVASASGMRPPRESVANERPSANTIESLEGPAITPARPVVPASTDPASPDAGAQYRLYGEDPLQPAPGPARELRDGRSPDVSGLREAEQPAVRRAGNRGADGSSSLSAADAADLPASPSARPVASPSVGNAPDRELLQARSPSQERSPSRSPGSSSQRDLPLDLPVTGSARPVVTATGTGTAPSGEPAPPRPQSEGEIPSIPELRSDRAILDGRKDDRDGSRGNEQPAVRSESHHVTGNIVPASAVEAVPVPGISPLRPVAPASIDAALSGESLHHRSVSEGRSLSAPEVRPEQKARDERRHDPGRQPAAGPPALRPGGNRTADQIPPADPIEVVDLPATPPARAVMHTVGLDAVVPGEPARHRSNSEKRSLVTPQAPRPHIPGIMPVADDAIVPPDDTASLIVPSVAGFAKQGGQVDSTATSADAIVHAYGPSLGSARDLPDGGARPHASMGASSIQSHTQPDDAGIQGEKRSGDVPAGRSAERPAPTAAPPLRPVIEERGMIAGGEQTERRDERTSPERSAGTLSGRHGEMLRGAGDDPGAIAPSIDRHDVVSPEPSSLSAPGAQPDRSVESRRISGDAVERRGWMRRLMGRDEELSGRSPRDASASDRGDRGESSVRVSSGQSGVTTPLRPVVSSRADEGAFIRPPLAGSAAAAGAVIQMYADPAASRIPVSSMPAGYPSIPRSEGGSAPEPGLDSSSSHAERTVTPERPSDARPDMDARSLVHHSDVVPVSDHEIQPVLPGGHGMMRTAEPPLESVVPSHDRESVDAAVYDGARRAVGERAGPDLRFPPLSGSDRSAPVGKEDRFDLPSEPRGDDGVMDNAIRPAESRGTAVDEIAAEAAGAPASHGVPGVRDVAPDRQHDASAPAGVAPISRREMLGKDEHSAGMAEGDQPRMIHQRSSHGGPASAMAHENISQYDIPIRPSIIGISPQDVPPSPDGAAIPARDEIRAVIDTKGPSFRDSPEGDGPSQARSASVSPRFGATDPSDRSRPGNHPGSSALNASPVSAEIGMGSSSTAQRSARSIVPARPEDKRSDSGYVHDGGIDPVSPAVAAASGALVAGDHEALASRSGPSRREHDSGNAGDAGADAARPLGAASPAGMIRPGQRGSGDRESGDGMGSEVAIGPAVAALREPSMGGRSADGAGAASAVLRSTRASAATPASAIMPYAAGQESPQDGLASSRGDISVPIPKARRDQKEGGGSSLHRSAESETDSRSVAGSVAAMIVPARSSHRGESLHTAFDRRAGEHPAPPPTIRVTIGRIEVRSSQPQKNASRTRPARPAPGLTLENYLHRRNGGTA